MQELEKIFNLRNDIIEKSILNDTLSEEGIFETILPNLVESKIIETPEVQYAPFFQDDMKINAYDINSTGERLLIFTLNTNSLDISLNMDNMLISSKSYYEHIFKMSRTFIDKAIKKHINPPADISGIIISKLASSTFINDIDVIEIFQLSLTTTIETRGGLNSLKNIDFKDDIIHVNYSLDNKQYKKDILIKYKLIDLNLLDDLIINESKLGELTVDFKKYTNGFGLRALEASYSDNFISYLSVIPANVLSELYRNESTRLLENNVRSFLSFKKDANSGMKKTLINEPERFIAYNNGLTITATNSEIEKGNNGEVIISKLYNFQIVNGGQTTASIYFTQKEGVDISKVSLMAKINVVNTENRDDIEYQNDFQNFISNISRYSNTQSKVDDVDFTSNSEEVKQIKRLSISVHPPTKDKWFFELMRGEFSTMIALAGSESKKKKIKEIYSKERVLDVKNLGKFYGAWGDMPHLVKLGGVKFNRIFLENLKKLGAKKIDREFYEELIAKSLLWESLNSAHGVGKNAIGNLRSAVVPYSISSIYNFTNGSKNNKDFNFTKIWIEHKFSENFVLWSKKLMILINELIKKYSIIGGFGDDIGMNTRKNELWQLIKTSNELITFFDSEDSKLILKEYEKKDVKKNKSPEIDFYELQLRIDILSKGYSYYKKLSSLIIPQYNIKLQGKVDRLLNSMYEKRNGVLIVKDIDFSNANFIKTLLIELDKNNFNLNEILGEPEDDLKISLDKVISIYNNALSNKINIQSEFDKYALLAEHKKINYAPASFRKIGKDLNDGKLPEIINISYISKYYNEKKSINSIENQNDLNTSILNKINQDKYYIKKIINQDLERTPTFSVEAIREFFNVELKNGESKVISVVNLSSKNSFGVEFKLRETRNEYRIFLNDLFKEINPKEKDILVFRKTSNYSYTCEHISTNSVEYKSLDEQFEINKNHKLIVS